MTFDPKQFLILSKIIMDDSHYNEEARYRTAVSRVYYAAHLIIKKTFEDIGVKFPIDDDKNMGIIHMMVIDHLLKINDPIGRMLKSLRKNRNKADYKTLSPVKGRNQSIITFSNKILSESGFKPGESVTAIFENGKIILVRDIEEYILEKNKII